MSHKGQKRFVKAKNKRKCLKKNVHLNYYKRDLDKNFYILTSKFSQIVQICIFVLEILLMKSTKFNSNRKSSSKMCFK